MSVTNAITPEQKFVMQKFSWLVGRCLRYVESALPAGEQREALKKLIEDDIYETRNLMLEKFAQ